MIKNLAAWLATLAAVVLALCGLFADSASFYAGSIAFSVLALVLFGETRPRA